MSAERSSVSVVVPTRDRPLALEACLNALDAQTVSGIEVVVVDDGSILADEVAGVVASHPGARLVRLSAQGPAAARNAGVREALGTTICLTDDDCVPEPDWVAKLVAAIQNGADAVAGRTLNPPGALAAASEVISGAPAAAEPFAPSNNLASTKTVMEAIPFDESYREAAAEDRDWCARLIASGRKLHSEPLARVVHRPRLTLWTFLRRQVRYGQGAHRYRTATRRDLEPVQFYTALVRRGFARGFAVGILVSLAQLATALGWARGWRELRSDRA
jgi:glycosyltransferase involved in cell wall biosynthesis